MAHPRMYDEDDPLLARVRPICLGLPEAREVEAWGRPTFRAGKKIFAVYSSDDKHDQSVVFKPEADERAALLQDDRFYLPPYFGPAGWLALDLVATPPDWEELAELVEASYCQVALKRMLAALDDR
ncbi:MAG: MmcQ/YjbR family DNA-binding protein [Nocardioidaceae bacterium]